MIINYDVEKINKILLDFYNATGINMDLRKADFSFINNQSYWEAKGYCKEIHQSEMGRSACRYSDECLFRKSRESKEFEMLTCHAGLTDISVPILYGEEIIGYVIFGQLRTDSSFEKIKSHLASLELDTERMECYYREIACYDIEKIRSVANIAKILIKHILLENILRPGYEENIQRAISYIHENLEKNLSVQEISKNAHLSKSALYRGFHSAFRCTVREYINKQRIEQSKELLLRSDLSIEAIAQKIGYTNGSYFSKMFKKEQGISPLQYKRSAKGREKA